VMPRLPKGTATVCMLGVFLLPQSATSSPQAGPPAHFPFCYAQYGCAPTDALALDFYFTAEKSECGKYREPLLKISIWRNLPKSTPYSIELRGGEGGAIRCLRPAACEAATSGSLHLDSFIDGKISSGEYELHFKDGSVEKSRFDATWCHVKFVCG
jgi:hypothetical protein